MPPKVKIGKEDIIKNALELCRKNGDGAINARSIAASLGCSTQPIFSNFKSMEELDEAVIARAHEVYLGFLESEAKSKKYPKYKAFGMAYIRFAKEEKELFKMLFMCDRNEKALLPTSDFNEAVSIIADANGISKEKAELMHLETWACTHGIATMMATSFLEFEWDFISDMLTDVYQGIRARHLSEDKNGSRN